MNNHAVKNPKSINKRPRMIMEKRDWRNKVISSAILIRFLFNYYRTALIANTTEVFFLSSSFLLYSLFIR